MKNAPVRKVRDLRKPPPPLLESQASAFERAKPNQDAPNPPFITHPNDSNSPDFQRTCLAWWLMTTKTTQELQTYLEKQNPNTQAALVPHLAQCKAWIWLCQMTDQQIRKALFHIPAEEQQNLRQSLNTLKHFFKCNPPT